MARNSKGQFVKGHIPFVKGTKGFMKINSGSFKKGRISERAGKKFGIILYKQYINENDKSQGVKINLSQGYYAFIDEEDWERVNQYKWCAVISSKRFYAVSNLYGIGRKRIKMLKLHRFILNASHGIQVDHVNHDTLDNRKENLRLATNAQNQQNKIKNRGNTPYKGVCKRKGYDRYRAYITFNKKRISLGDYGNPELAARAYNKAAIKYHGEFANLNVI